MQRTEGRERLNRLGVVERGKLAGQGDRGRNGRYVQVELEGSYAGIWVTP